MGTILHLLIFLSFLPKTELLFGEKCSEKYNRVKVYWMEYLRSYIRKVNGTTKGNLPKAIEASLHHCCKTMNFSFEEVRYSTTGYNPMDNPIVVENATLTLLFPILGGKGSTETVNGYQYLPIKTSPGPMVLAAKGSLKSQMAASTFVLLTLNPTLVLLLATAASASVLFWLLEFHKSEKSSSPFSTFIKEIGNSLWFSVVTMTTVGYGDLVPRYRLARCFTVFWMFMGTVLISMFTAHISSALTAMQVNGDKNLIGRKLGVLRGTKLYFSSEINFGANVIEYSETDLFRALDEGNISRILLPDFFESLYVISQHKRILEDHIAIVETIKQPFSIGMAIGNDEKVDGAFLKCWSMSLKWAFNEEQKIDYSAISLNGLDATDYLVYDGFLQLALYIIAASIALFALAAVKMIIEQRIPRRLTSTEREDDGL